MYSLMTASLPLIILMALTGSRSATLDTTLSDDASPPVIQSSTISVEQLPAVFDPARTFHYRVGHVENPQRLLLDLWEAGLRPRRAWQPLDDRCFDPVGPQFTVQLRRDDSRILELGFERGAGRLQCATTLTRYRVRKQAANYALNLTVRPVTRLAGLDLFSGSNENGQGARPSRPAGYSRR